MHIRTANSSAQLVVSYGNVWSAFLLRPVHVLAESLFKFEVANLVTICIIVQQTVKTDTLDRDDRGADRGVGL